MVSNTTVLKAVWCVNLFVTALLAGIAFAHVLELPNKMRLPPATWLRVQQVLYNLFGPVGGALEIAAILSSLALLVLVRRRGRVFALTLLASILLIAALAEWAAVVNPVNDVINTWTPESLPVEWTAARDRWEYGHAVHALLVMFALGALIVAAVLDRPAQPPSATTLS